MADVNKVGNSVSSLSIDTKNNIFDRYKKQNLSSDSKKLKECFDIFDSDRDGFLSRAEFSVLLKSLFSNNGAPYSMSSKQEADIFKLLDENQDNRIDLEEFKICWQHWLPKILNPVCALLIIDVQNDFVSGTLAIKNCPAKQDGEAVIAPINSCLNNASFDVVCYSFDWHPKNHISFIENVGKRKMHHDSKVTAANAKKLDTVVFADPDRREQKLWPTHCVQESWGAQTHPDLKVVENALYVNKGTNPDIDSYSAFWDNGKLSQTQLLAELTKRNVTDVYVCGLAYDVCVAATTRHSLEHGFRTYLIEDACRGVDEQEIAAARDDVQRKGAAIVNSQQVADLVACNDRRPELGYFAALQVAMARKLVKSDAADQRKED